MKELIERIGPWPKRAMAGAAIILTGTCLYLELDSERPIAVPGGSMEIHWSGKGQRAFVIPAGEQHAPDTNCGGKNNFFQYLIGYSTPEEHLRRKLGNRTLDILVCGTASQPAETNELLIYSRRETNLESGRVFNQKLQ